MNDVGVRVAVTDAGRFQLLADNGLELLGTDDPVAWKLLISHMIKVSRHYDRGVESELAELLGEQP